MNDCTVHKLNDAVCTLKKTGASDKLIYEFVLSCFENTPYKWGGDMPDGSDCSGTVCRALSYILCGKYMRTTADGLYRFYFTQKAEPEQKITALFFIDPETEKAVHISGYAGCGLYMNCSRKEPGGYASFRTKEELLCMYSHLMYAERSLGSEKTGRPL